MRDINERKRIAGFAPEELDQHQLDKFNRLLGNILPQNAFYAGKFSRHSFPLQSLEELGELPFTFKEELVAGEIEPGFAANLTYPFEKYSRFHRTSGTRGRPMVVLDTQEDWEWWMDVWQYVLDSAEVTEQDRVMMAFSFGPFIGFWSANDACLARGALVIPAGGLSTVARLELIRTSKTTLLFSTPTYALHLAEIANQHGFDLVNTAVDRIVVAGEPGGSVPAIRERITNAWGARVIDHSGASEVGPWGFADPDDTGLFVNEADFIAEFASVENGEPANDSELSELILTALGREGCPVIRYRTGDLVRPTWNHGHDCRFVLLEGGVLGRMDDMMIVRGVNVFPSSIEQVLRSFPEIVEYRMTAYKDGEMDALSVEVEDRLDDPTRVATELNIRIGLKINVTSVPIGTLPRFDAKGKRFVDNR